MNPPVGANFYPLYTTGTNSGGECVWHLGGTHIPGTTQLFGGNSHDEFGPLLQLTYPGPGFMPIQRYNDFRRILRRDPCAGPPAGAFSSVR